MYITDKPPVLQCSIMVYMHLWLIQKLRYNNYPITWIPWIQSACMSQELLAEVIRYSPHCCITSISAMLSWCTITVIIAAVLSLHDIPVVMVLKMDIYTKGHACIYPFSGWSANMMHGFLIASGLMWLWILYLLCHFIYRTKVKVVNLCIHAVCIHNHW